MNKEIMKKAGFAEYVKNFEDGICPICKKKIRYRSVLDKKIPFPGEFTDALSIKEFHISGLCQSCQDRTFG